MTTGDPRRFHLRVMPGGLSMCRLDPASPVPAWADGTGLVSITRTPEELSIVCPDDRVPAGLRREDGYRAVVVAGPLAPDLVGVLASLASPLADAGVPVLVIGTFDTDYFLVRGHDLGRAIDALRGAGHVVS